MYLHRQMDKAVRDAARERKEFWVVKLLTMLSDRALRTAASTCVAEPKIVVLECNFVDQVWDDPRIERRVQALSRQGIEVEKRDCETTVGKQSYTRQQLVLTF